MPPRSTGCFTCRKRKIRCDEGRPGCDKCAKHGVPCPGYRRERAGFEFEDQTAVTVQRAQGQRGSDSLTISRKPSGKFRPMQNVWQTSDVFHSWQPIPQIVASPLVAEEQMYDKFIDIYTPKSGLYTGQFDYLRTISQMVQTQPALKDGLDTLALVQVGSVYKDERLLDASVRSYGKALGSLAKAVAKATSVRDDTVLAAASLLVVCEFYDKIKTAGMGWFGHIMGVEQLLLARGPDSLTSDLALWLFCNARVGSLARSFLLRKSDPYASAAWRLAAFRAPVDRYMSLLFDSIGQIPGLLERHDRLDSESSNTLSAIEGLLDECEIVEQSLRGWIPSYHRTFEAKGLSPYITAPIENFAPFASVVSDRTLTTAYKFQGYTCGHLHSQYWIGMHYLRSTIKSLREARQDFDPQYTFDHAKAVTDEELHGYAFSLCGCLPYFLEPTSGTQGHVGCFLSLAVIMFHFRTRQNWKWLRWGLEVKNNIFNKGLRQPTVREEDLPTAKMLAPPRSVSMFHHGQMESDESAQDVRSRGTSETRTQPMDGGFYDDMADVSLAIDWGQTAPGMVAAATGPSTVQSTEDSNQSWSVEGFNDVAFCDFDDGGFDTTFFADLDYSKVH